MGFVRAAANGYEKGLGSRVAIVKFSGKGTLGEVGQRWARGGKREGYAKAGWLWRLPVQPRPGTRPAEGSAWMGPHVRARGGRGDCESSRDILGAYRLRKQSRQIGVVEFTEAIVTNQGCRDCESTCNKLGSQKLRNKSRYSWGCGGYESNRDKSGSWRLRKKPGHGRNQRRMGTRGGAGRPRVVVDPLGGGGGRASAGMNCDIKSSGQRGDS